MQTKGATEAFDDRPKIRRQNCLDLVPDLSRQRTVISFGHGAGDAGQGVAVTAQRNGIANGVFIRIGIKESNDRLRNGSLAGNIEPVGRPDAFHAALKVVSEAIGQLFLDQRLVVRAAGQEYGQRRGLRPFDAFGMVVADLGRAPGFEQYGVHGVEGEADGADPHGRAIAPAAVWPGSVRKQPLQECTAVAGMQVAAADFQHPAAVIPVFQDGHGRGDGEDGIVGEAPLRVKQREALGLDGIGLIDRPDNISGNGTDHGIPSCAAILGALDRFPSSYLSRIAGLIVPVGWTRPQQDLDS